MKNNEVSFTCTSAILPLDKLHVKIVNNKTKEVKEETFTIEDPELLQLTNDIIWFPLKELALGLLFPEVTIKSIFNDVYEQAKYQIESTRKYLGSKKSL